MSESTAFPNTTVSADTTIGQMTTTSTPLDFQRKSIDTIVIVSLCVAYFWCASFSAYEFISKRELLSQATRALQLCLGIQSLLRCIFMLLAYFTTPNSVTGAEFELAVLGDLPGIFYAFICGWLSCEFISNHFDLRTNRGQSYDLILKVAMVIAAIIFTIAWSITVVLVSSQAPSQGRNYANHTCSTCSPNMFSRAVICGQVMKWNQPRFFECSRSTFCMSWWRALLSPRLAYSRTSMRPPL